MSQSTAVSEQVKQQAAELGHTVVVSGQVPEGLTWIVAPEVPAIMVGEQDPEAAASQALSHIRGG